MENRTPRIDVFKVEVCECVEKIIRRKVMILHAD